MFSKQISSTPFTSDAANDLFGSIACYGHPCMDASLLSTLRALLHHRAQNESIFVINRISPSATEGSSYTSVKAYIDDVFNDIDHVFDMDAPGLIIVYSIQTPETTPPFDLLDREFIATYPGFVEQEDLRRFVASRMKARFYTNQDSRLTVIFVDKLTLSGFHFLQSLIPRYFPWFFKDNPLTDQERDLLASLTARSAVHYESALARFASYVDFRSHNIKVALSGVAQAVAQQKLKDVDDKIRHVSGLIANLLEQYTGYISLCNDLQITKSGLEAGINAENKSASSELIDFFIHNKSLNHVKRTSVGFSFVVCSYLDSFDPDLYQTYINNPQSYINKVIADDSNPAPGIFDQDGIRLFFNAIFSEEPVLRVKLCAFYNIDLRGSVSTVSKYAFPSDCSDRIPNPHLHYYACLGNHRRYINEALLRGDYVSAVEQCVSSSKSLNIGESITVKRFLFDLLHHSKRVIELPDGTSATPTEALSYLRLHP